MTHIPESYVIKCLFQQPGGFRLTGQKAMVKTSGGHRLSEAQIMEVEESVFTLGFQQSNMELKKRALVCNYYNDLRLKGNLCDVVIRVDSIDFNAHKNILCSCSHYFRSVLIHSGKPFILEEIL